MRGPEQNMNWLFLHFSLIVSCWAGVQCTDTAGQLPIPHILLFLLPISSGFSSLPSWHMNAHTHNNDPGHLKPLANALAPSQPVTSNSDSNKCKFKPKELAIGLKWRWSKSITGPDVYGGCGSFHCAEAPLFASTANEVQAPKLHRPLRAVAAHCSWPISKISQHSICSSSTLWPTP